MMARMTERDATTDSLEPLQEISHSNVEGVGERLERLQRHVRLAPFNLADMRPVEAGAVRQHILGPAALGVTVGPSPRPADRELAPRPVSEYAAQNHTGYNHHMTADTRFASCSEVKATAALSTAWVDGPNRCGGTGARGSRPLDDRTAP